jgi:two-component system, NarL family, response regulator NreC
MLERQGFEVIGEAEEGRRAVQLAKKLRPDIVIIDIGMPGLNGVEATRQISTEVPQAKIIVLSMHSDSRFILGVLGAGACGYLLKDSAFEELSASIRAISEGQTYYLSPAIADVVVRKAIGNLSAKTASGHKLSSREQEILQLIAEGRSTREIAATLYVSVKTVETHRKQIMDKLNIHSIAELTKYAIREGITSL